MTKKVQRRKLGKWERTWLDSGDESGNPRACVGPVVLPKQDQSTKIYIKNFFKFGKFKTGPSHISDSKMELGTPLPFLKLE
jgi:hypothetical protein